MKKYNIIVAVFAVVSVIYLLKLNEFSVMLLNERASGKTDLELLINHKEGILLYAAGALAFIIIAAVIVCRILREAHYGGRFEDYINASVLCFILIIIITITIKFITIPVMQILLSGVAVVGGITALIGSDS
jgi:hypothetical protein